MYYTRVLHPLAKLVNKNRSIPHKERNRQKEFPGTTLSLRGAKKNQLHAMASRISILPGSQGCRKRKRNWKFPRGKQYNSGNGNWQRRAQLQNDPKTDAEARGFPSYFFFQWEPELALDDEQSAFSLISLVSVARPGLFLYLYLPSLPLPLALILASFLFFFLYTYTLAISSPLLYSSTFQGSPSLFVYLLFSISLSLTLCLFISSLSLSRSFAFLLICRLIVYFSSHPPFASFSPI